MAFLALIVSTHARVTAMPQDEQEDSVINVVAYFCKGDTMKYSYTHIVGSIAGNDTTTTGGYTRNSMLVVADSTSKGYKIEFTPMEVNLVNDKAEHEFDSQLQVAMQQALANIKIKFRTDECGSIIGIDNWREVKALYIKGVNKALDNLYKKTPEIETVVPRARFESILSSAMSKEEDVRSCIDELEMLFSLHGNQFKVGSVSTVDESSGYPVNAKIAAAYATEEDENLESDEDYIIATVSHVAIPSKDAGNLIAPIMQSVFSGETAERASSFMKDSLATYVKDSLVVENMEKYDFFGNGWPACIASVQISGFAQKKKMECKNLEWTYRAWKGFEEDEEETEGNAAAGK